ncbi:MAG: glycoside hydrolase family 30 protein [Solirubrobacteraceae bacterium]
MLRCLALGATTLMISLGAVAAGAVSAAPIHRGTPKPGPRVHVTLTSADLHQALNPVGTVSFASGTAPALPTVAINDTARYQTMRSVGGAMTDTSAWLIQNGLTPGTRGWLMRRLFGASGLHLGFLRIPMGASDFTAAQTPYTYDDVAPGQADVHLDHFSIAHDVAYILPALRAALAENPKLFMLAAPWSPPAWMKTTGALGNPHDVIGSLLPAAYEPLAQYFVRFLKAYRAAGIPVGAITPQNEPGQNSTYPGLNMDESSEAALVTGHLAPVLHRAGLHPLIYGYDNNWYGGGLTFASDLALGPAAHDLAGIASHCYFGAPTALADLHRVAPNLEQMVSECSPGALAFTTSELEISTMRNWATAVNLWNLALDPQGGPVQRPNYGCRHCTGIVTIDPVRHTVALSRDYYQLGQFSRYVVPGAVRLGSNNFVTYTYAYPSGRINTPGLDDVAFQNPDGSRVLLTFNSARRSVAFAVKDAGDYFRYRLAPGATATFVWTPAR